MAAESNSSGLLVAPMTSTLPLLSVLLSLTPARTPSKAAKNSVFILRDDSCSSDFLDVRMESISSEMNRGISEAKVH